MIKKFSNLKELIKHLNSDIDEFLLYATNINTTELFTEQIKTRRIIPFEFYLGNIKWLSCCEISKTVRIPISPENIEIINTENGIRISLQNYFEVKNVIDYKNRGIMFLTNHKYKDRDIFLAFSPRKELLEYFIKYIEPGILFITFVNIVIDAADNIQFLDYKLYVNKEGTDFNFRFKDVVINVPKRTSIYLSDVFREIDGNFDKDTASEILLETLRIHNNTNYELHLVFKSTKCLNLFKRRVYKTLHVTDIDINKQKLCAHIKTLFQETYGNLLTFETHDVHSNVCIFVIKYKTATDDILMLKYAIL